MSAPPVDRKILKEIGWDEEFRREKIRLWIEIIRKVKKIRKVCVRCFGVKKRDIIVVRYTT